MSENKEIKKKQGDAKRRNKGEGTIRKKGNSYEGRVTIEINGLKKQVSICDRDKRIVIQRMNELKNESYNNACIMNNRITVREWFKQWINTYKRGTVRNNTLSGYIRAINQYIDPEIGDYELQKIQPIHVQQLLTKMKNGECKTTQKKLSAKTASDVYCVLNMAFEAAVDNNLLKNNCIKKVKKPKIKVEEPQIITLEEQRNLENLFSEKYDLTIYLFLMKTGERASEAAGSNWDNIDFENKVVRTEEGLTCVTKYNEELEREENTTEENDLKNKYSERKIPMLFGVYDILIAYRKEYMRVNNIKTIEELNGKPLFLTNKGNRIKADFLWKKLDKFLKSNGLRHIGVHQLRHTFATRCLEAGISQKYLQKMLGHSTPTMTNRYTHLLEHFENEENKKIDMYYENNIAKVKNNEPKYYKGNIKRRVRILRKIA